jgi:hypothetical protein
MVNEPDDIVDIDELMSFEKLEKLVGSLPMTWYPALLTIITEASYAKNVWQEGGASRHVRNIEEKLRGAKSTTETDSAATGQSSDSLQGRGDHTRAELDENGQPIRCDG